MAFLGKPWYFQNKNLLITFLIAAPKYPRKSTSIDAIECFTNNLMFKKNLKWESFRNNLLRNNNKSLPNIQLTNLISQSILNDFRSIIDINIQNLSQNQLDNILISILESKNENDLFSVITQCLKFKKLPSDNVVVLILKFLSVNGEIACIEKIEKVLIQLNNKLCATYLNLLQFKGLAYWKINNLNQSLKNFESIFEKDLPYEGKLLLYEIFALIADDTFNNKGEAALVLLNQAAKNIYQNHNDIYLLACIWKCSFYSKYYTDQNLALNLIEQYNGLQKLIANRSISLCGIALSQHDIDAVYRLIELYLKYRERDACKNCLHMLFDYQYFRKDVRACVEISKTCSDLEMPLNRFQNEKYLKILLNQPKMPISVEQLKQNKFVYKF